MALTNTAKTSRTVESLFDEAKHSGILNLSNRKLKSFPRFSQKCHLPDTLESDLSGNRFTDIPPEVFGYSDLEKLNCYDNVLKCIPQAIIQLQSLVHLNLSRNQLSFIPEFIGQLKQLQVLLASNNHLVSMPEEISELNNLMELDLSCNEITHLPQGIGELENLRYLNVRSNLLVELPCEMYRLQLQRLDISDNKISIIPNQYCQMIDMLEDIRLKNNPLISPPAKVCSKGGVHIMKYLENESLKEDRKQDILGELDLKHTSDSDYMFSDHMQSLESLSSDIRFKRRTIDSGYSTTDSSEQSSSHHIDTKIGTRTPVTYSCDVRKQIPLEKKQLPKMNQAARNFNGTHTLSVDNCEVNAEAIVNPSPDEFTKELQKQKLEYEERKKRAEVMRKEFEKKQELSSMSSCENEREETRKMALKLQEEQQAKIREQREQVNKFPLPKIQHSGSFKEERTNSSHSERYFRRTISETQYLNAVTFRSAVIGTSNESTVFGDPVTPTTPTPDDTNYMPDPQQRGLFQEFSSKPFASSHQYRSSHMHNVNNSAQSNKTDTAQNTTCTSPIAGHFEHNAPLEEEHKPEKAPEFRRRREAMISQQRQEAQLTRRRLEEEKLKLKQRQKEAVIGYINKCDSQEVDDPFHGRNLYVNSSAGEVYQVGSNIDANFPECNQDAYQQTSTGNPPNYKRALDKLEAMSSELNNINPGFTVRRQLDQYISIEDQIEELRKIIESRLKVKLPDDLPTALRDGVVLCHLANHIRPRSISSIHVPSQSAPKLSIAKCRRNVENFLEACRRIGVSEECMCSTSAILEPSGIPYLCVTIQSLISQAAKLKPQQSTV